MTAPDHHDDAAPVAAARRGDRDAFAALVERHCPRLLRTCARAARDADVAADAAQEAVVAAMVGLERPRRDERFGAWLIGIGLNLCRRRLREAARRSPAPVPELPADGPGPHERAQAAEEAARVRAAVAALPDGQRAAVALFHVGDLDQTEVARRLGTPVGAVKTRLHKVELPRPGPYHFAAGLLGAAGTRLREVRISALAESIFYARAILADGTEVDARPSDALTLALVSGALVLVGSEVLERAERSAPQMAELVTEALQAGDDARTLADETRARIEADARELAEIKERMADGPAGRA